MANFFSTVMGGAGTLIQGMRVTARYFFRPPVTLRYPRQQQPMTKAYRSAIEFVNFEETGTHDCIACNQCAKICPSDCIVLDGDKPEGIRRKRATSFEVDFALCSLCGLCIDICPTDTLKYSHGFDESSFTRISLVHDLLEPYRDGEAAYLDRARAEQTRIDEEKKAEAARKAAEKKAAEEQASAEKTGGDSPAADTTPPQAEPRKGSV